MGGNNIWVNKRALGGRDDKIHFQPRAWSQITLGSSSTMILNMYQQHTHNAQQQADGKKRRDTS